MKPGLHIYGAGGHGMVVAESVSDHLFCGFIDDNVDAPQRVASTTSIDPGLLVIGKEEWKGGAVIVGIGDNATRQRLQNRLRDEGHSLVNVEDSSANVSVRVTQGEGIYIGVNAVVNARAVLANGVIINTAAIIEHDCHIHAFAHIAPNATLCGGVEVGKRTLIGAGAVVIPKVKIGDDCIVGAGSVVTKDVPSNATVVGNPARLVQSSGFPHDEHDHMTGDGTILA